VDLRRDQARAVEEILRDLRADPEDTFLLGFGVAMSTLLLASYLIAWLLGRSLLGPVGGRDCLARR